MFYLYIYVYFKEVKIIKSLKTLFAMLKTLDYVYLSFIPFIIILCLHISSFASSTELIKNHFILHVNLI